MFARAQEILLRPVELGSRSFPLWQVAVASTVLVVGAVSIIRRLTRPKYGFYTTADQVMEGQNLTGQKIIITGANTGLGRLTTQYLVGAGATVVLACRSEDKANNAIDEIINSFPNDEQSSVRKRLSFLPLDLNDFDSIYNFAKMYSSISDTLDQLINNAGIMAVPNYRETKQGFEQQFGVNHMGHSYLTLLLTPLLKNSAYDARVICLSSSAHRSTNLNQDFGEVINKSSNGPVEEGYTPFGNYSWSKTSNMLFAYEYNRRHYNQDGIAAVSLHPGGIQTELGRHLGGGLIIFFILLKPFIFKSISQGIATTLRCATLTNGELIKYNGEYFADCNPSSVNKNPIIGYMGSRFLKPDHNPKTNDQFDTIASDFYDWTIKTIQNTGAKMSV